VVAKSTSPLQLTFVTSAAKADTLPFSNCEVAIVGRSNVGKSSLINALANHRQLAHVSTTPGRTQLLNMFEQADGPTVMDLPGYGYAKVPAALRGSWQQMIEGYLLGRESLQLIFTLIDGEIGPTKLDVGLLDWVRHHELPIQIVATKIDKVRPSKLALRKEELANGCGVEQSAILWVSSSKGTGVDEMRAMIRRVTPAPQEPL
jgi:GTP-binding protein